MNKSIVNKTPGRCSDNLLKQLAGIGIKTTGTENALKDLITKHGFGLPCEHIEMQKDWILVNVFDEDEPQEVLKDVPRIYFGFQLQHEKLCHVRLCLTMEDALAEELILLKKLKLI